MTTTMMDNDADAELWKMSGYDQWMMMSSDRLTTQAQQNIVQHNIAQQHTADGDCGLYQTPMEDGLEALWGRLVPNVHKENGRKESEPRT